MNLLSWPTLTGDQIDKYSHQTPRQKHPLGFTLDLYGHHHICRTVYMNVGWDFFTNINSLFSWIAITFYLNYILFWWYSHLNIEIVYTQNKFLGNTLLCTRVWILRYRSLTFTSVVFFDNSNVRKFFVRCGKVGFVVQTEKETYFPNIEFQNFKPEQTRAARCG